MIIITEIMYDAPGTDARHEWIEVYNGGNSPIDISKWKIGDGSAHVLNAPPKNGSTGSLVLAPSTYAIIASDAAAFNAEYKNVSSAVIDSAFSLPNTSGTVSIMNASGSIEDSVSYSKKEGAAGDGNTLQRTAEGKWIAAAPTAGGAIAAVTQKILPPRQAAPATPQEGNFASRIVSKEKESSKKKRSAKFPSRGGVARSDPPSPEATAGRGGVVSPDPVSQESAVVQSVGTFSWWLLLIPVVVIAVIGGVLARRTGNKEWNIEEV